MFLLNMMLDILNIGRNDMNFDSGLSLNNYLYSQNQKSMIFNHFLCENFALTGQDLSISNFELDSDLLDLEVKASEHFGEVGFYLNDREGFIGSFVMSVDDVEEAFNIQLKDKKLLVNMIETPDGTLLQSKSRYDFVAHKDKNGSEYFVDGGLSYLRRGGTGWIERSLYEGVSGEIVLNSKGVYCGYLDDYFYRWSEM